MIYLTQKQKIMHHTYCSCTRVGAEILHLVNLGDYDEYEIIEIND